MKKFRNLAFSALGAGFVAAYVGYKLREHWKKDTCRTILKSKSYTNTWIIEDFKRMKGVLKSAVFSGTTVDGEHLAWSYTVNPSVEYYDTFVIVKMHSESGNAAQEAEFEINFGMRSTKFYGAISAAEFRITRCDALTYCSQWNGTLTLTTKITFIKNVLKSSMKSIVKTEPPRSTLVEDYANLLSDKKSCDIKIKVGQRTFHAHKTIFVARSKVFAAMFQHDMQESQRNKITIPNMDPDVFEEVLRFIYTDKAEGLPRKVYELLEAADLYDLARLKALCEIELIAGITVKSATKTLEYADLYRADDLKARALQFIAENLKMIQNWEEFCSAKPKLVAEILDEIAKENKRLAPELKTNGI